jgi:predicted nucleic acid-binding protein
MNELQAKATTDFIKKVALVITERSVYRLSPDPKDNYLFDLAIQNNCAFIISDDTKLLHLKLKPVPVHTANWFLKKFPIK